ncbi:mitotic spindle checkpoint component mad2 [Ceraceosorus bombacis]|uniref:Mitotic spindle checkpoint component mad2 n=1 Tax=Ceraceosorus bombacis TaxID=401625 RepID=A0A0N7LA16_9BASI|nr:mitotic spindle checkpoint component mad2 [Ceraceosorus bombacis]
MATAQATAAPTRTHLTLSGSTAIVSEFFEYSLQSILYQRGVYPPEDFKTVRKYGLQMLVSLDDAMTEYVERAKKQLEEWLLKGAISRVVVAIIDTENGETVERWQFDVNVMNKSHEANGKENEAPVQASSGKAGAKGAKGPKTDDQVKAEIAAIIKQITASCTFLPMLEDQCSFTLLAYTNASEPIPIEWAESDARLIAEGQAEQVRLRSFSTAIHQVDSVVAYRRGEED